MVGRIGALLLNLLALICWAVSSVLIRSVRDSFPVHFQNFYRYLVSAVVLWVFVLSDRPRFQAHTRSLTARKGWLLRIALIAAAVFGHQYFMVASIYLLLPGIGAFVQQASIVFTMVLVLLFVPTERLLLRSRWLYAGITVAALGLGTVLWGGNVGAGAGFGTGILLMLLAALCWSIFSVMVRCWIPDDCAPVVAAIVFTINIPAFLMAHLLTGDAAWPSAPPQAWVLLTVSGLVGIGAGYTLYYASVPAIGATLASSIGLLFPVLAVILSFLVFGERFTFVQAAGATVLLAGCYLVIRSWLMTKET